MISSSVAPPHEPAGDLGPLPSLPFAPGESPFRVRGGTICGLLDYLEERAPGKLAAMLDLVSDEAIRTYMQTIFLATAWYDFVPTLRFAETAAEVLGTSTAHLLSHHAAWQVQRDVRGVNRLLMKFVSPEAVVARSSGVFERYYNFGKVTVVESQPGGMVTEISKMP